MISSNHYAMDVLSKSDKLSCRLTTPELQERKRTIIAQLKEHVQERMETAYGFRFRFSSSDAMLDLLNGFIKTERLCCDFFVFTLTVSGTDKSCWLELAGPEGAKAFVEQEIGL